MEAVFMDAARHGFLFGGTPVALWVSRICVLMAVRVVGTDEMRYPLNQDVLLLYTCLFVKALVPLLTFFT